MDASPIVDHGTAYRYMVKYASKEESRSRDAQRLLARLVRESAAMDEGDDNRSSLQQIVRRVLQTCTTRRDMGAQELMRLLIQTPSVHHSLEFVIASIGDPAGGLRRRAHLLEAYARRRDPAAWGAHQELPPNLGGMSYSLFAATFRLNGQGLITALTGRNRVVSSRPFASSKPRGPRYHEYCRNRLVKFRPWEGELWQGWGGDHGELATTDDPVAQQGMIANWVACRDECLRLDPDDRPRGFSARDAHLDANRRQPRWRQGGDGI